MGKVLPRRHDGAVKSPMRQPETRRRVESFSFHSLLNRVVARDPDPEAARFQAIHVQVFFTTMIGCIIGGALDAIARHSLTLIWLPFIFALGFLTLLTARRPAWRVYASMCMYLGLLFWVGWSVFHDVTTLGFVLPGMWAALTSSALAEPRRRGLIVGGVSLAVSLIPLFKAATYEGLPMWIVVVALVVSVCATTMVGTLNSIAWQHAWRDLQAAEQRSAALTAELGEASAELEARVAERTAALTQRSRELQARTDQLRESLEHRTRLSRELTELSVRDELTGLYNRRHLLAQLQVAVPESGPLSLLLLDLDHFKRINDEYGHPAGDQVLVGVSEALAAVAGEHDIVARTGGEEFAILLPETTPDSALQVAELCRRRVVDIVWPGRLSLIKITISVGVSGLESGQHAPWENLMRQADNALYQAKRAGRDRVVGASLRVT